MRLSKIIIKLKSLVGRVLSLIYTNATIVLYEHKQHVKINSPAEVKPATAENLKDILNFQHPRYLETFVKFLKSGDKGYFAYLDGQCVHRSWVKHTPQQISLHPMLQRFLKEGEAFIHYCETAPTARGKNIYPHVLSRIVDDFRYKERIMIAVNEKNTASRRGVEKAGFTEKARFKIVIIMGIKIIKRFI